ncbi:WecB/TagA/CpsF family glycosyltransferase [Tianweitania populi]|uniref:UDP-N-acetyl-D-mannosaminuronic acid transferase n=1 Tax=Tianweitania populi TaxID=1607949 RepID=A0A8J3GLY0_9HYPH|nr:WecB/TagA/CpsF family glycosyltransferase [Tianweitania populi]GHD14459.1 UDP-N-acetyl-D-mannosaminuronic acid transferase [Tianweitania populi]
MTVHSLPAVPAMPTRDILGTPVAALGWQEAIDLLNEAVEQKRFTRIGFMNAHNANLTVHHPRYAKVLKDFIVLPDGIGVDIASSMLYGSAFPANLNGTDFVPEWLATTKTPLTVALLGAKRNSVERARSYFEQRAPQHRFVLIHDGFFDEEREKGILTELIALKPDVLIVAMGVPRQELWIADHITLEHCILPIGVGALFDLLSGTVPRAPPAIRNLRMEWVYRLAVEPRRLFRRYVLGVPAFLWRVMRQRRPLGGRA